MTTILNTVNLSDVPLVDPQAMALPMQFMIDTGRGLAMLRGISKDELREVDHALWQDLSDDPVQRIAVLMRFRCLIRVFGARRLADMLLQSGFNLIAPAIHVAARMRLNAEHGFNPLKFERALQDLMAKMAQARAGGAEAPEPLAA